MILMLIEFLTTHFSIHVPAAFSYSSTRMILAAITTLFFTIFLGSRFIKIVYELKTGQSIRVDDVPALAERHQLKKNTPTMGGLLILSAMLFSLFLWMDLKSSFTLLFFIATVWLGILGGVDDYLKMKHKNSRGLKSRVKFLMQLLLALIIALYLYIPSITESVHVGSWFSPPHAKEMEAGKRVQLIESQNLDTKEYASRFYVPFYKQPLFVLSGVGIVIGIFFTLFVITGSSNAVNLTDGLDGLAAGCLVMVAGVLAIFAFLSNNVEIARYLKILYIEGSGEIAIYLFSLFGACLGFLWYNGYPAQVFMGDTGSLALGGIIGLSALLLRRELLLALVGGVFVFEALSVIIQVLSYRYRNRRRVFLCAPLHHHFEYQGWPETKVVIRFWIISLILAMVGLVSLKFQ